jgi:hypothetical protein
VLALSAASCLSTGEPLFREDTGLQQPAESAFTASPTESAPTPPAEAPAAVSAPEQYVIGALDPASSSAAAPGSEPPEPAEADVVPEPPPAVAVEPCAGGSAIVCDSFEAEAENTYPSAVRWEPELAGCGSHRVDGAGPSFSGTHALRADGGGYPECMLHADLSGQDDVYVRTRVFIAGDESGVAGLGDSGAPGAPLSQYLSLFEFGARAAQDDPELRIGVRPAIDSLCPGVPGVDVSGSGLVGGPATECTGFELLPERWYCIEAHLMRSGGNLSVNVAVDGTELVARDFTGSAAWATRGLFFKIGRASYGASGGGSLWHDDVAVGREPLPCAPL